jgi:ATP adenylyltransferase
MGRFEKDHERNGDRVKQLWAPWRMPFILGEKYTGCILCEKPKESRDKQNLILHRGEHGFVMLNLYPYNNGHLMISPYQHASAFSELSGRIRNNLMALVAKSEAVLRKSSHPEGINFGSNLGKAAGAGIADHLHFHLVPRWGGDTNFMTVAADVRVIPENIQKTYSRLKPYFK